KSHYFCTAERARTINELSSKVKAYGAISLNNAVGGFNPIAVEMAARDGAKIVWMPTVDSKNEMDKFKTGFYKNPPGWAKFKQEMLDEGIKSSDLTIYDESGIRDEVREVLNIISKYNLILATGHLGKKEIFDLVKLSKEKNIKKVVVTHPNFPSINLSKEEQKELAEMGAIMEHCFTTPHTNKMSWNSLYEEIKYVGFEKCILSTDLGQHKAINHDEGMKIFIDTHNDKDFSKRMITRMIKDNPSFLVE